MHLLMDSLESDQQLHWRREQGAGSRQAGRSGLPVGRTVQSQAISHWNTLSSPGSP